MKNIRIKYILLPILLITFSFSLKAQSVTGTVSDQSGPLPGANVVVKGTNNGTTTDFDGNYTLSNVGADDTLVFSYIGFRPQEVPVNGQEVINVTLQEDLQSLDEVVVVGYGTQTRASVTGAISSIDAEEISALPVATADQALQGRAAGVTVINSGSPGTAPVVRIRGLGTINVNDPLYVIDGVITNNLGDINVNDIESINVLKDASTAAIYGSRGANGVIMVTTKKGRSGVATLSFNAYTGMNFTTERYDLLNTEQYIQYASALGETLGRVTDPQFASFLENETDWQDEIFRTGVMKNYDLSVSGGSENSNYRISAGVLDQEGTIIETGFERYSFRANSEFTIGKLKIGENAAITFNKQNPERAGGGRSLIEHAIKSAPYLPVYNPNNLGGFQGPSTGAIDGQDAENPVRVQTLGHATNKATAIVGNIYGELEIFDGLKFRSQVGLEHRTFNNNIFIPSYNDDSEGSTHSSTFAQITKNSGKSQTVILTNSLNYTKTIAEVHNFEVLLLAEKTNIDIDNTNITSQNPISDDVDQVSNEQSAVRSQSFVTNRIGYLGRLNYNMDQKYILSASLRRDASSRFGANNRWGWFPSVSVGWNVAKEEFMQGSAFSNFKIRGSWGIVGNDLIPDYLYSATLTSNFIYPIDNNAAVGTAPSGLANPDLKWEETTMKNIGLDLGLFNDQFTMSVEYYINTSDDLLMGVPTPTSLGIHAGNVFSNVGSVETKGLEANLGYNDFEGDFTWSANLNLGTSKNEVLSLGTVAQIQGAGFEGENISRIAPNESAFHFWGLETDGIYQTQEEVDQVLYLVDNNGSLQNTVQPGDIRFVDRNGDGQINNEDKTIIGNPIPELTYGLNLNATYKAFDLNMFISGVAGNDVYNTNIYDLEGMPRLFNAGVAVLDRWTGPGTSNSIPRAQGAPQNVAVSDRFVEDGSYTRLRNITLGYTLPEGILSDYISKFRLYVSGQNLITITDYSGLDPEVGNSTVINNTAFELGIDRGNYPQPKSFLLGLQVTF